MKGVFGILLTGGGVILLYGLFTGKITFSGTTPQWSKSQQPYNGPIGSPANPTPTSINGGQGVSYQGSTGVRSYS